MARSLNLTFSSPAPELGHASFGQHQKSRVLWAGPTPECPSNLSGWICETKTLRMLRKSDPAIYSIDKRIDVLQAEAKTLLVFFPPFSLEGIAPRASAFSRAVLCTFGNLRSSLETRVWSALTSSVRSRKKLGMLVTPPGWNDVPSRGRFAVSRFNSLIIIYSPE